MRDEGAAALFHMSQDITSVGIRHRRLILARRGDLRRLIYA